MPAVRVGIVSSYPPTHCGIGEYTRMLAAALRSVDPGVEVLVFSDRSLREPWVNDYAGARVVPLFERGSGAGVEDLPDALAEAGGVDVLHVQHDYSLYGYSDAVLRAALRAREEGLAARVVFTMHTVHHPYTPEREALGLQSRLGPVDAVVVHSPLQEFELRSQGVPGSRLARIPHGTRFNPYLGLPRHQLLQRLGLGSLRGALVVVPGFLKRDKGLDTLLEALRLLGGGGGPAPTLVVAGEVWDRGLLGTLEEIGRLVNLVLLERYLEHRELLMLLAAADLVLLPYRHTRFYSVSGMLHLALGGMRPVIGTRVPKLAELYQYAPRLTTPPGSPGALARLLRWALRHYETVVTYMSFLYSYAARTEWRRVARRHLRLYRRLLRGGHAAG
ncbi:glycosyltransferase [Pyrodictium occultum]|uniref:glycosyltransferase n=1 Tax=Pyrodictium occultum TaxID=2309 RepID=UPI00191C3F7C|nr:glycosyltransferase [Pyrodictium occultum]